jgi:hypothetical protein
MEKRPNIPEKTQQTIDSLDGLQRATPGPFFFTRVMARIEREDASAWERAVAFLTRPVVVVATLSIIVLLNATALYLPSHESPALVAAEQSDPSFTDDYVAANTFYEFENADAGQ